MLKQNLSRYPQPPSTSVVGSAADGRLGSWNSVRIPRPLPLGSSDDLEPIGCHLAALGIRDELEAQFLTFVEIADA